MYVLLCLIFWQRNCVEHWRCVLILRCWCGDVICCPFLFHVQIEADEYQSYGHHHEWESGNTFPPFQDLIILCLKSTIYLPVWRDSLLTLFDYLHIFKDIHYHTHGWNYVNLLALLWGKEIEKYRWVLCHPAWNNQQDNYVKCGLPLTVQQVFQMRIVQIKYNT